MSMLKVHLMSNYNTTRSPSDDTVYKGFWNCQGISGCCYNNVKPEDNKKPAVDKNQTSLNILFSGLSGANIQQCVKNSTPPPGTDCSAVSCQQNNYYECMNGPASPLCAVDSTLSDPNYNKCCQWETNYLPKCDTTQEECWLNFGGGAQWHEDPPQGSGTWKFTVNINEYYDSSKKGDDRFPFHCHSKPPTKAGPEQYLTCPEPYVCKASSDSNLGQCVDTNGNKPTGGRLGWLMKRLKKQNYTGVVFDYENPDAEKPFKMDDWQGKQGIVEQLKQNGFKTALTMDDAGLMVVNSSTALPVTGGYPATSEGVQNSTDIDTFLANAVAFDYNIPQLYGGWPMFYTGEHTDTWDEQKFYGYFAECSQLGADDCKKNPLELLCNSLNDHTKLLPTFGAQLPPRGAPVPAGQAPQDALERIKDFCGKNINGKDRYDGESFVSWNIYKPTDTSVDQSCLFPGCQTDVCPTPPPS